MGRVRTSPGKPYVKSSWREGDNQRRGKPGETDEMEIKEREFPEAENATDTLHKVKTGKDLLNLGKGSLLRKTETRFS